MNSLCRNSPIIDHLPYRLGIETWNYPKAGDPNPTVKLGVVQVAGGTPIWVDTDEYAQRSRY